MGKNISTKFMVALLILSSATLIFTLTVNRIIVSYLIEEIEHGIYSRLEEVSKRGAQMVSADVLNSLNTADDMYRADYQLLRNRLSDLAKDTETLYIYYLRPVENNKYQYVICSDFNLALRINLMTVPEDISSVPGLAEVLAGDSTRMIFSDTVPQWEDIFTVGAPVYDEDGNIVAVCRVDVSDDIFTETRQRATLLAVIEFTAAVIVLISFTLSLVGYRRESKIAQALRDEAQKERDIYFEESTIDELTNLNNRRAFQRTYQRYAHAHRPDDKWLCLAVIDIDYFKKYNDFYGHPMGDECLRKIGEVLNKISEDTGIYAARIGGEEFAALWFDNRDICYADDIVSRILNDIRALNITHEKSDAVPVITVSIGAHTEQCGTPIDMDDLYKHADDYLYQAKNNGKNRAVVSGRSITD